MKVLSRRSLDKLRPVLLDQSANGPDPVYEVYTDIEEPGWVNKTIIQPGRLGQEFPKTFGHYHSAIVDETYRLVEGEGILLLQKKTTNQIEQVVLIKAKPGDEIVITPEWGHSWSNIGEIPLVSYDDWSSGHSPTDYQDIEDHKGMAYYLIEEDGEIKAVKNSNYDSLPEPIWMTPDEFKQNNAL